MKTNRPLSLLLCCSLAAATSLSFQPVCAQDDSPETKTESSDESVHDELRALRETLAAAVLKGDTDAQIAHVDENVVTTWQNNKVVRGHDGLRKFLNEMSTGNEKVFQGYTTPPTADELTILHGGDTGIAFGTSVPHYKYLGMEFDLENRWTATLVKDDGKWKIAAYHVSANILDNPVLTTAKNSVYWVAGIALVIGLVLGCLGGRLMGKKSSPDA